MTIIIPYANNPTDFSILLMQLQMQKLRPNAIYVADNSVDGSGFELVQRYQFNIPIVVEKKAGSIYESWNKGLAFAGLDDVVVLNDDVLIPWDFCEVIHGFLLSGSADMYCPANSGFPPTKRVKKPYNWYSEEILDAKTVTQEKEKYAPIIKGWCFALPSETIQKIGTFDEQFTIWYGDKDYEKRIFDANGSVMFVEGLNVHHYGTSSYSKLKKKDFSKHNYQDQLAYEAKYNLKHKDIGWG